MTSRIAALRSHRCPSSQPLFAARFAGRTWNASGPRPLSVLLQIRHANSRMNRLAVPARLHVYGDFHILIELAENGDQTVKREAPELDVADARKLRGGDAGQLFGGTHAELAIIQDADD